ncbi:MAG TPA: glycoside hydrolase family 38 C-terminal domain-containing protein [Thermoleophilaceae bacterium]|nr:glycoside hydrolase family 38 C-terminal domain-containing protein [Thermoleophilaceae bacterium]
MPHTHWDREWYLPLEDFRIRLAQVVDELIETLEARPEHRFTLDGQAIVLEDYLEIRPEMEGRLRALLASGRVETGPSYVLPDEFLVGGESLVRNLLHGRAVCARYGATPATVGYLPDSFGHPAQLPQLLRGFGLGTFVFSRGLGDERERVGARFRWRAPDGSEVLALPQPVDYAAAASLGRSQRSDEADPARNAADRIEHVLRAEAPMLADQGFRDLFLGNGFDHAALQADLPDVLAALRELKPGVEVRLALLSEYARAMAAADGDLPAFEGELLGGARMNVLRGVNSTRMYLKQHNERCERELASAGTLCALALLTRPGFRHPRGELRLAWRELLRNHPHDSICGCSVDEVHADMGQRFRTALQIARRVADMALHALGGSWPAGDNELEPHLLEGAYRWAYRPSPGGPVRTDALTGEASFVNTLPFRRRRLVALELPAGAAPSGAQVEADSCGRRAWFGLDLDGFSATTVSLGDLPREPAEGDARPAHDPPRETAEGGVRAVDERTIENRHLRVTAARDGTLTVLDRASGVGVEGLHRLEDVADRGDSYTFCALEGDRPLTPRTARARVTAAGAVVAELELSYELELPAALAPGRRERSGDTVPCPVVTRVRLAAGSERVELTTTVANRASDHRLRVRFPCPGPVETVRAEGHFGVTRRPARAVWSGSWFEPPHDTSHTLGAVAAGGLVVLGKGLPEYEATEEGELALTLLRCVGWLSREDLSTRRGAAGPQLAVPGAQCHGDHVFEYAVELGEPSDAELLRRSQDYRFDFVQGAPGVELESPLDAIEGDLVFSALKAAEDGDGVILRVFDAGDAARGHSEGPRLPPRSRRCRLDESPLDEARTSLRPGEIATYKL